MVQVVSSTILGISYREIWIKYTFNSKQKPTKNMSMWSKIEHLNSVHALMFVIQFGRESEFRIIQTANTESFNSTIQTNTFIQFTWMISWFCIFLNSELIYMQSTQCSVQRIYTFIPSFSLFSEIEENGQLMFCKQHQQGRTTAMDEWNGIEWQKRGRKKYAHDPKCHRWMQYRSCERCRQCHAMPCHSMEELYLWCLWSFAILFAKRVEWLNIILAHLHLTQTLISFFFFSKISFNITPISLFSAHTPHKY